MSERRCHRPRSRLEWSAHDLPKNEQERILDTNFAANEQGVFSDSDDDADGAMPLRLAHRSTKVLRWLLDGKANPSDLMAFDVDGFLAARPARHWILQIKQLGCKDRSSLSLLKLLRGPVTFYEALRAVGPEMSTAARMVQAVSQQRLFESCSVGFDMVDWSVPLEVLLRSGASLLRTDIHGRVAAHLAAAAECDVLGVLLHIAPSALLVEDSSGQTPLELLVDSPCLEQAGARTGVKNALIDALLECLCAFPQHTFQVLKKSANSLKVLERLASEPGMPALLLAASEGVVNVKPETCAAAVQKSCKVAFREEMKSTAMLRCTAQRVRVLKEMTLDSNLEAARLEPEEMQLQLLCLKTELQNHQRSAAEREAALEQEVRRLKSLLAQCEDDLLKCRSSVSMKPVAGAQPSCQEILCQGSDSVMANNTSSGKVTAACAAVERTEENYEHCVIREIRRSRLLEPEDTPFPQSVQVGLSSMQASLAAAVNRLAKDLYDSETHFVHEMMQNADDTAYGVDVLPELRFTLGSHQPGELPFIFVASNQMGFQEADVRALCDISRSTKSGTSGATTGHKGVGWKAVFRVCHAPHVLSGRWCFKFSSEGLGMITPEWVNNDNYTSLPEEVRQAHSEGWTVFFLPLTKPDTVDSILEEFHHMEANTAQLIFFRRLQRICICSTEQDTQMDLLPRDSQCMTGLVNKHVRVNSKQGKERSQVTTWSTCSYEGVTVACPLVEKLSPQHIFAVLPVRKVGFNFAVQAQFQLTTSRADFHRCPENMRLRSAAAHAFLNLCRSSDEVAARAFDYLGNEPADTFWLPARMAILAGLQDVACIPTEGGERLLPAQCLLRGDGPIGHWVPEDILNEACSLKFVDPKARHSDLCDLGLRKFGFIELCACLSHDNGKWIKAQWLLSSASVFYSNLFEQLVRDLQADTSRIVEVQKLRIFPVELEEDYQIRAAGHSTKRAPYPACPQAELLHRAADVHAGFCSHFLDDWQVSLIRRISPKLQLSSCAHSLLTLLGISIAGKKEVEREALRWLLRPASVWPSMRATWPALHVLCLCHSLGFEPPRPWNELRGAIVLPSETGELLPPSQLRLRSFLGVESKLPPGVVRNVCEFAGLDVQPVELHGRELVKMPVKTTLSWLEWEAFFWTLGCTYMNPMIDFGEACVEATLELGKVLSSTSFWQAVATKPCVKRYLQATIGDLACPQLRMWLSQLPAGKGKAVLNDLFFHDLFYAVGGNQLPYVKLSSRDPAVERLLRKLGVAMDFNEIALLKCLRWMKSHAVQDVGLVADIYEHLARIGCSTPPGEASVILIPGNGYLRARDCCWEGFQLSLLQKCCPLQPISEYYARFGPLVQNLLLNWVVESPQAHAPTLCRTLRTLILCAKQVADTPYTTPGGDTVKRQEVVDGLSKGAQIVFHALASVCSENEADAKMVRLMFSTQHRLIVVSIKSYSSRGEPFFRLLDLGEAYWSVAPELHDHPCAHWQLQETYGTSALMEHFFVHILGVRSMLQEWEKDMMTQEANGKSKDMMTQEATGKNKHWVAEGLTFKDPKPSPSEIPFDLFQVVNNALQRARGQEEKCPAAGVAKKHIQNQRQQPALEDQVPAAAPKQEMNATGTQLTTTSHEESCWQCIGEVGGFPLFSINGVQPSPHLGDLSRLDSEIVDVLQNICKSFGLEPDRLAFAYDPLGRSVGRDQLFLDASKIPRVSKLPLADAEVFWTVELAQTIAHQGMGRDINEDLLAVTHELIFQFLPKRT